MRKILTPANLKLNSFLSVVLTCRSNRQSMRSLSMQYIYIQHRISNTGFPIPHPIPSMMDGWPAGYDGWMATIHDGCMEEKRVRLDPGPFSVVPGCFSWNAFSASSAACAAFLAASLLTAPPFRVK